MVNFKRVREVVLEEEKDLYDDFGNVHPEFIIDDEGRTICTKHSEYDKIEALNLAKYYPNELEKILTCFRCDHFKNDVCYFPKAEIERIEQDRLNEKLSCKLCGMKIHRLLTILQSFYYREKFNIEMPVICCTCYAALNNNTFYRDTKRRMIFFGISLAMSLYFLFSYLLTIFYFSIFEIFFILVPFLFFAYISIKDLKSIYNLYKGRRYYKELQEKIGEFEED